MTSQAFLSGAFVFQAVALTAIGLALWTREPDPWTVIEFYTVRMGDAEIVLRRENKTIGLWRLDNVPLDTRVSVQPGALIRANEIVK